jgi:type IV secretion system protein VirB5
LATTFFAPVGENSTGFTRNPKDDLIMSDTFNGLAQKNARTWQIIALVSLSAFFVSLILLGYAITLPKTIPIIVTVDGQGQSNYIGRIDDRVYNAGSVPEIAKEYMIRRLITLMHTWVIDQTAQTNYIEEAYTLIQEGAASQLDLFYRANNPFALLGTHTKSVDIEPPLKQSDSTYITYFTTTEKDRNGYTLYTKRFSILLNIALYQVTPKNPLGLFITNFDIKQLEIKE